MDDHEGTVRILLADEQSLFRQALRVALESQPHLAVVAEAATGCQAAIEAARTSADVAVMSSRLPHCDGIEATMRIGQEVPRCRVLILADQADQQSLLEALEAGAAGFLSKDSPLHELIHAVEAVHRGETLVPSWMLGSLLSELIRRRREEAQAWQLVGALTRREREVLFLLADGKDHNGIAAALVISPETARTHIQNVLAKLGVHSRLEAAAFVARYGLLRELVEAE
jgi:DNA-binding NarL/FixJ family response regulator